VERYQVVVQVRHSCEQRVAAAVIRWGWDLLVFCLCVSGLILVFCLLYNDGVVRLGRNPCDGRSAAGLGLREATHIQEHPPTPSIAQR
jgi:hypothetical protein